MLDFLRLFEVFSLPNCYVKGAEFYARDEEERNIYIMYI
jgi:hypothetical protein